MCFLFDEPQVPQAVAPAFAKGDLVIYFLLAWDSRQSSFFKETLSCRLPPYVSSSPFCDGVICLLDL